MTRAPLLQILPVCLRLFLKNVFFKYLGPAMSNAVYVCVILMLYCVE